MANSSNYPARGETSTTNEADALTAGLTDDIEITLHRHRVLKLQDITWRLENRENFRKFLIILLVAQNVVVFSLVTLGLLLDKLEGLQLVFSVLVAATLAETASMIFFIIKWLFSEIQYQEKNDEPKSEASL